MELLYLIIMQLRCISVCPLLNIKDKVSYLKLQKVFDIKMVHNPIQIVKKTKISSFAQATYTIIYQTTLSLVT